MDSPNIRIVIVDDHPVVRAGLASMLGTHQGIEVIGSASTGAEVLALLEKLVPDVILIDLRMPGMSGSETIRAIKLRENPPRIIVLTNSETDEDIYQAVGAGADGYLPKNTSQDGLLDAIRRVRANKQYFPAHIAAQLTDRMARSDLTPREKSDPAVGGQRAYEQRDRPRLRDQRQYSPEPRQQHHRKVAGFRPNGSSDHRHAPRTRVICRLIV